MQRKNSQSKREYSTVRWEIIIMQPVNSMADEMCPWLEMWCDGGADTAASYGHIPGSSSRYLQLRHTTTALRTKGLYTFIATPTRGASSSGDGRSPRPLQDWRRRWRRRRPAAHRSHPRPARRRRRAGLRAHPPQSSSVTSNLAPCYVTSSYRWRVLRDQYTHRSPKPNILMYN